MLGIFEDRINYYIRRFARNRSISFYLDAGKIGRPPRLEIRSDGSRIPLKAWQCVRKDWSNIGPFTVRIQILSRDRKGSRSQTGIPIMLERRPTISRSFHRLLHNGRLVSSSPVRDICVKSSIPSLPFPRIFQFKINLYGKRNYVKRKCDCKIWKIHTAPIVSIVYFLSNWDLKLKFWS